MESFLNCLWVLIAALILGLWRLRWTREHRDTSREPLREWTAIGCALVLLFFAVSLTDDLHSEAMLSDDCYAGRHHSSCVHSSLNPGKSVRALSEAVLPGIPPIQSLVQTGRVVSLDPLFAPFVHCNKQSGRAPPPFSF
jgi:hypothetical protein